MAGGSQAVLSLAVLRETRCEYLRVRVAYRGVLKKMHDTDHWKGKAVLEIDE